MACVLVVACTFRRTACAGRWVVFVMVVVIFAHLAATSTVDAMPAESAADMRFVRPTLRLTGGLQRLSELNRRLGDGVKGDW